MVLRTAAYPAMRLLQPRNNMLDSIARDASQSSFAVGEQLAVAAFWGSLEVLAYLGWL
jgi:hypothetical protein